MVKVYLDLRKVYLGDQAPDNRRRNPEMEAVKAW